MSSEHHYFTVKELYVLEMLTNVFIIEIEPEPEGSDTAKVDDESITA